MTNPEKKSVDLLLEPKLDVKVVTTLTAKDSSGIMSLTGIGGSYMLEGITTLSGRVTFSIVESLSRERMWFKSIDIPKGSTITWKGTKKYEKLWDEKEAKEYIPSDIKMDYTDPGFTQAVGAPIEQFYITTLETAWKYLDPEEMKIVSKQAEEVRQKKVY